MEYFPGLLNLIVIFDDQNTAHTEQCLGVAMQLSDITDAEVASFSVPKLEGMRRFIAEHRRIQLLTGSRAEVISWLKYAKGETLLRGVSKLLSDKRIRENSSKVLFISAGDEATAYNLAIAQCWKVACAVIGCPRTIGTKPFEFAIVPEYENIPAEPNILKVVMPPENVRSQELAEKVSLLKEKYRPKSDKVWSLLVGGSNADCRMSALKLKQLAAQLISRAKVAGAELYVRVSENVPSDCSSVLKKLAEQNAFSAMQTARSGEDIDAQAFIGLAEEIFCTEDAPDMVSKTVTCGKKAVLLRTGNSKGIKTIIGRLTEKLIEHGAFGRVHAAGNARYSLVYDRLRRHGRLTEFRDWLALGGNGKQPHFSLEEETAVWKNFNEAARAAKWIAESLVE